MINRELQKVSLITYEDGVDEYGQVDVGKSKVKSIDMTIKPYNHSVAENPNYTDIELIGLSKEDISQDNRIQIGKDIYTIPYPPVKGRWNMYYLQKQ